MFYRWQFAPAKLAKMFKDKSAKCWKCHQTPETYYHMWWSCIEAKRYWTKIHTWLEKMIKQHIDLKSEIFLLGMVPEGYSKEKTYLIIHVLTAASIVFAQNWKNDKISIEGGK
uniref:Reverse transcriptase zinc-binding domain-containing protein n=1 Tax=Micrurus spixii TaxID=129469 RepID=A0A2D4LGD4_9SAUR